MLLSRADWDDHAFHFGGFDDAFARDAPRLVRAGERCVDAGAQKGFFAMILARAVGPAGAVLAVEADPAAVELLGAHRERNGLTALRVCAAAAGDREGERIAFHVSAQIGWSSRFPNPQQAPHVRQEIVLETRTLDALIAERMADITTPISMVKIDVEGSELRVLRGMQRTLDEQTPMLWMEVNRPSLAAAGTSPFEVAALLARLGYRYYLPDFEPTLMGAPCIWYTPVDQLDAVTRAEFDVLAVPPRYAERWAALGA